MVTQASDITGRWDGTYRYSGDSGPVTPFVAALREVGTGFSGEIIEPNELRPEIARAFVSGIRAGRSIDFTKTYLGAGPAYETPVDYSGQLSGDGRTITGRWFLVELDGTFEMHREADVSELVEALASEAVPQRR